MPSKRLPAYGQGPASMSACSTFTLGGGCANAAASRSTASTSKPSRARSRAWRPAPQATSSTAPPGRIHGSQRCTHSLGARSRWVSIVPYDADIFRDIGARMRGLLRWVVIAVAGLVLLAGIAFGGAVWMGERKRERVVDVRVVPVPYATDAASLRQGKYLFESRGCAE